MLANGSEGPRLDSEELRWTEPNDAPEEGTLVGGLIDPSDHVADLDTGATLGRYVVLAHMGTGAMGVVYSAYDPQLDRKIALKLMHAPGDLDDPARAERASARMLAEAKAMAQLSHPNVITVHDVGTIDGRVFIAMEFVEGAPLSTWMREPGRDWRELLEVFIRAGRGLEAAHAAGLVHRDFKPDNVLVGVDGRVRVLDFGLARRVEAIEGREREAGTPAYMSPEQHLGKPLDHRSDQFSFCVALYEALYAELPFAAKTRLELALAVTDGRVGPAPKRASVPNWVRWALLRGLDPDPEGRWDSIGALLEALAHDPYHKLRKAALGVGVAALVVASMTLLIKVWLEPGDSLDAALRPQCTNAGDRVAEVWDERRRASVREAFARVDESWAAELAAEVDEGLGRWAERWAIMHRETCEASALGEQSDTMLDRRMLCLDRRLAEFDELVEVVTGTEAQSFERALEAVGGLPDLDACEAAALEAGEGWLANSGETTELERLTLATIERDLFRANSLEMTGAFAEAITLIDASLAKARALDDRRLIATALLSKARLARAQGKLEEVAPLLEEAELMAERAAADRLRGEILVALARAEIDVGEIEAAARRVGEARAVLERVDAGTLAIAELDGIAARTSIAGGELERAEQELRAAIDSVVRSTADAPAPVELAALQTSLGVTLRELGRYDEARTELDQAAGAWAEHYGEQHPVNAVVRFERALIDDRQGRLEPAVAAYLEVLTSFERAFGANSLHSLDIARTSEALGLALGKLGRYDESLRRHQQARAIYRANLDVEGAAGRPAALGLARTLDNEGVVRRELGQLEEALSLHQRALGLLERDGVAQALTPARVDERSAVLVNLARVLLALERADEARAASDEALQLHASLVVHSRGRGEASFVAARAWAVGPDADLARSRSLALEARKEFVAVGDREATRAVERWLEEHS